MNPFKPPFEAFTDFTYAASVEKVLESYQRKIQNLSINGIPSNKIKNISDYILKSIKEYLSGNSGLAYNTLAEILNEKSISEIIVDISSRDNSPIKLYKARSSTQNLGNRDDIFHLPFNRRHLVKNYRFSISGVPSLYLGSSTFICWVELNQPNFSEFWISKYEFDPQNKIVIDFTYSIEEKINDFKKGTINLDSLNKFCLIWPLIIASTFKKKYPLADFHEEYIIPNIILQWIRKNRTDLIGLKYISTKTNIYNADVCTNYVFPTEPKEVLSPLTFCETLKKHFRMTYPLPWYLLTTIPQHDYVLGGTFTAKKMEEVIIEKYNVTQFGLMEKTLDNFTLRKIPKTLPLKSPRT